LKCVAHVRTASGSVSTPVACGPVATITPGRAARADTPVRSRF